MKEKLKKLQEDVLTNKIKIKDVPTKILLLLVNDPLFCKYKFKKRMVKRAQNEINRRINLKVLSNQLKKIRYNICRRI